MSEPIRNAAGHVALRYIHQQRILVSCHANGRPTQYVFDVQGGTSLAWVREEDVACCMAMKGGCCGQKKVGVIIYANETDVKRWTTGNAR